MTGKGALEQIIRWVTRDTLYYGDFIATVQAQHDDDTLDLLPDDERVRGTGLVRVPMRLGIPGLRVRVKTGARVQLSYENGNPDRPVATMWELGGLESLSFDGGTREVARNGDPVDIFWPPTCAVSGTLGGLPFTGFLTIVSPSPGIIHSAKDNVLA